MNTLRPISQPAAAGKPAVMGLEPVAPPQCFGGTVNIDLPKCLPVNFIFNAAAVGRVVSLRTKPPKVQVKSFSFAGSTAEAAVCPPAERSEPAAEKADTPASYTRLTPSRDVIKLGDRLEYVLQPPLELLLADSNLFFPCRPYAYQYAGVAFLFPRQAAILADEMGLGKTMQTLTAIRLLIRQQKIREALIVCPKPLVSNWLREAARWAPEITVMAVEGETAKRRWGWSLPDVPLRITNYESLLRDEQCLAARSFDLVVLDEAQRIKNPLSATNAAVCALRRRRSWALTGTPVENSPQDLVGIFGFLVPDLLSPEMTPTAMRAAIADYVLRRTKEQVLDDLPPKLIHDVWLELTPEQEESYRLAEEQGVLRLKSLGRQATIRHVFELILRLKQICNFDPLSGESAKLERLEADLEEIVASGRKAVVFSQWVGTLRHLRKRLAPFAPLEYHGRIPVREREAVLARFRDEPNYRVLLISYGAGGVGLNLQFAEYVFLFDRWWNPAVEAQAINRAHRIGAQGAVNVVRFITLNTIEERIDRILEEKQTLFETIFAGEGWAQGVGLDAAELFGLFQLALPEAA